MEHQNDDVPVGDAEHDPVDDLFDEEAMAALGDFDVDNFTLDLTALPKTFAEEEADADDDDPDSLFVPLRPGQKNPVVASTSGQAPPFNSPVYSSYGAAEETHNYSLRTQAGKGPSTYLDQDQSGDYDPSAGKTQQRQKKPKKEVRYGPFVVDETDSEEEGDDGVKPAPLERPKLIVCLTFNGASGKQKLEHCLHAIACKRHLEEFQKFTEGRRLRDRRGTQDNAGLDEANEHIIDHPTGHPAARGCIACLKLKQRCSILDDEKQFPCDGCQEVGEDCKLIITPVRKHACAKCKRLDLYCSYEYTEDHTGRCHSCEEGRHPCVAAPIVKYTPTRIRLDHDWPDDPKPMAEIPPPAPTVWSCWACRTHGRICSFIVRGHQDSCDDVCTACEMKNIPCAPILLADRIAREDMVPSPASTSPRGPKQTAASKPAEKPTTSAAPAKRRTSGAPGLTPAPQTITTRLNHPILFNSADPAACAFCPPASLPVAGLPARTIQVQTKPPDPSLHEVPPASNPTRICIRCTTERLCAATCDNHTLVTCPNPAKTDMRDAQDAFEKLYDDAPRAQDRWCSLCVNLADYVCVTVGPRQGMMPGTQGCGLMLCELCKTALEMEHFGDIQELLNAMTREGPQANRPLGFRADWELLKQDGLLMQHVDTMRRSPKTPATS